MTNYTFFELFLRKHITTHVDESPSASQKNPDLYDTLATPSDDIQIEKVEGDSDFLEDAETYKEEELEVVKINYEETEELLIKEELEAKASVDTEAIVKKEVDNEENEDLSKEPKENNEVLEMEVVVKEELDD